MRIERIWAIPNKNTFEIKSIKELLMEKITNGLWIDPFANRNQFASITNDLNPEYNTDYHMDALDFLKILKTILLMEYYIINLFSKKVSECYKNFGSNVT